MAKKNTFRLLGKEIAIPKSNVKRMKKSSTKKKKFLKLFGVEIPIPRRPRKAVPKRKRQEADAPPLPLPPQVMHCIKSQNGDVPVVFFAKKDLEESDVNSGLSRLFVPKTKQLLSVLKDDEREIIEKSGKEGRLGVTVVGPMGERYNMSLNLWPSLNKFVLIKDWVKFVKNYDLKAQGDMAESGNSVELWYFRGENSKLSFAINVLKDNQSIINGGATTSSDHNSSSITDIN